MVKPSLALGFCKKKINYKIYPFKLTGIIKTLIKELIIIC